MKLVQSTVAVFAALSLGACDAGKAIADKLAGSNDGHKIVKAELESQKMGLNGKRLRAGDGVIDIQDVFYRGMNGKGSSEICATYYDLREKRAIDHDQPDAVCIAANGPNLKR